MYSASDFSGRRLSGSYKLLYNVSEETVSIASDATEDDVYYAITGVPALSGLFTSATTEDLQLDVTRVLSAVEVEEYGPFYQAVHALPGDYYLTCPNEYTTCGFELLPPGDFIMLRDEVDGPYGDYHGRWYRVHSSYRPAINYDFLPLAELDDFSVPTTFKGSAALNTTILRWARGYSYHLHFSGLMVESNPWLIAPISLSWASGGGSLLAPTFEDGTSLSIDYLDLPLAAPNNTGMVQADDMKSLLASCSAAITNNMVSGQTPFQSIQAGLRMTSTVVSSMDTSVSTSSTQLLQTGAEAALGSTPFCLDLPMKGLEADEVDEDIVVSVVAMDASLYEVPNAVASDIVYVNMSSVPRYFEENTASARTFNVSIPTAHLVNYAHPTLPEIFTYCGDDDWATRTYSCEDVVMSDPECAAWEDIDSFYDKTQHVTATCNGTIGTIVSRCDWTYIAPTCDTLLTGLVEGSAVASSGCIMVGYNADSTTCACPLPSSSDQRRRLSTENTSDSSDSSAVEVNYVALAETVKDSFVETWTSTSNLDESMVEDGWQVLVVMSTLLLTIVASLVSVHRLDDKDKMKSNDEKRKRELMKKRGAKVGVEILDKSKQATGKKKGRLDVGERKGQQREQDKKESLLMDYDRRKDDSQHWRKVHVHVQNFKVPATEDMENLHMVEQSLPAVLRSKPFFERFMHEVKCFHRWFCIIYTYAEDFPRTLRVVSMASNVIVVLFIQALTYELTNPDDGSCSTYETVDECLAESSTFNPSVTKCTWKAKRYGGTCSFREPEDTLSIVIFVAIFSATVSIPLLVMIEWLVKSLLAAKTSRIAARLEGSLYEQHNEKVEKKQFLAERKQSIASKRRAKKALKKPPQGGGKTLSTSQALADAEAGTPAAGADSGTGGAGGLVVGRQRQRRRSSLLNLLSYQNDQQSVLTSSTQDDLGCVIEGIRTHRRRLSELERAEFDHAWGVDPRTAQFVQRRNTMYESRRDSASGLGNRAWLNDMASGSDVQDRITEDLNDIRDKVDDEYHDMITQPSMNEKVFKGKNLMLLFQQDMLPGVNGQILMAKRQRESGRINTVHPMTKFAGWMFIIFLNLTMVFYVYLFSLNQTQARQGAWLKSFLIWFIMEVFVVSTVICYVTHFLIPSVILKDLHKVKQRLLNIIRDYKDSMKKEAREKAQHFRDKVESTQGGRRKKKEDQEDKGFNAAAYFFVSYRLATLFPDLQESKIIQKFHSPWPRVNYNRARKDVKQSYNALAMSIGRSVAMVVFQLLGELVALPVSIQDMVFNFISTGVVGYTALLHVSLYEMMPVLVALPSIAVILIVHFFMRKGDHDRKVQLARTLPVNDESDYDKEIAGEKDGNVEHGTAAEAVPVQALTTEVLMDLERKRHNAYARGVIDYEVENDSRHSNSSSSSSSDGQYRRISIRTSLKRDSLASLDSADRFSDISLDPDGGSPLTIGAAHYLNSGLSPSLKDGVKILDALHEAQDEQLAALDDGGSQKYGAPDGAASDESSSSSSDDSSAISDATSSSGELHLQLASITRATERGAPADATPLTAGAAKRKTKFPKYLDADKKREEGERKLEERKREREESSSRSGQSEVTADTESTSGPEAGLRRVVRGKTPLTMINGQEPDSTDPEMTHPVGQPVFSTPKVTTRVEVRTADPISPTRTAPVTAPSTNQWQVLEQRMEALERSQAALRAKRKNIERKGSASVIDRDEVLARLEALEQRKKDLHEKKNSPPGIADGTSANNRSSQHRPMKPPKPAQSVTSLLATRGGAGLEASPIKDSSGRRRSITGRPLVVRLDDIKDTEDTTSASYEALDDLDDF